MGAESSSGYDDFQVRLLSTRQFEGERFVLSRSPGLDVELDLHDYARIYEVPGLYERVVQELLECRSPQVSANLVARVGRRCGVPASKLRVLDVGAGNGVSGEYLRSQGIEHLAAIDSIEQARLACLRDRPGLYESYEIAETGVQFTEALERLRRFDANVLSCVGALGGGHVPNASVAAAVESLASPALVVLTIAERWLGPVGVEGYLQVLSGSLRSTRMDLVIEESFTHRLDMSGEPIPYRAIGAIRVDENL
jgi:hypothetical protein